MLCVLLNIQDAVKGCCILVNVIVSNAEVDYEKEAALKKNIFLQSGLRGIFCKKFRYKMT